MTGGEIRVEVVYALPFRQDTTHLSLPIGTTVGEAIARSGVTTRHAELASGANRVAIYAHLIALDAPLTDQDRIEILRPLTADPKDARRRRAARRVV